MSRFSRECCRSGLVAAIAFVGFVQPSRAAEPGALDPGNAEIRLELEGLPEAGTTSSVRVVTALGAVQNAFAVSPTGMTFTARGAIDGRGIRAVLDRTGKVPGTLRLDLAFDGARVSGVYTGLWNKVSVTGLVSGAAVAGKGILEGGPPAPLELVKASYFGTPGNDDFEGAAVGPDGALYLAGNAGEPLRELPGGGAPVTLGTPLVEPLCGCGFVLKLSADASNVLGCVQLATGILHATAVAATDKAVYVGGFASDGLESLLVGRGGLFPKYTLRTEQKLLREGKMLEGNGMKNDWKDPAAGRPWLGRLGAPCVLRFSTDLKTLENGTYLEGWQQVYDKPRQMGGGYIIREFFWQPINLCPLRSGDIAVAHDGGYFRMVTDEDRAFAKKLESPAEQFEVLRRVCFYDVADYVSLLSANLTERTWKTQINTPRTDPEVADRLKKGWNRPYFGSPRTHRMRADRDENLWVAGWSATLTSTEPWWSPFLWKLDPRTGTPAQKLYNYDPMSGGGNRMGGAVADTAVLSVAVEEDGNLLACLISDGGNCVMRSGPTGKKMSGPVPGPGLGKSPAHFWGQVHRIDSKTLDGLGGAQTGPTAWTIDAAGLPDKHFLALGRWNFPLPWTRNAWWVRGALFNPNAFLRVVAPDYNTVFWTALPGVRPYELMPIGGGRYILVGFADKGSAPARNSLLAAPPGGEDAFFAIVRWVGARTP